MSALPTVDSQLAAVRRSLERLAARGEVGADVRVELKALSRALGRVERSWSARLPYLVDDNARLVALLGELADLTSAELGREITATLVGPLRAGAPLDLAAAERTNGVLRELLAKVIVDAGRGEDRDRAAAVSRRARAQLERSLEDRPW